MERIVQIHVEGVETPYPVTTLMVCAQMDVIRAGNQLINVTSLAEMERMGKTVSRIVAVTV